MSAPATKKKISPWKLAGSFAFLCFSVWLSLGPWVEDILGPLPFMRTAHEEQAHQYGGYEAQGDLLRLHGSFVGEARKIQDPFSWIPSEPDAAPGGISKLEVGQETITSTNIQQDPVQEPDPEEEIPQLDVRLILRTQDSSRVLVDGQILGVGDQTRAGPIVEISDTGIRTRYRGKMLFFALSPR